MKTLKRWNNAWDNFWFSWRQRILDALFFVILCALALLARWSLLDYQSGDYGAFLSPWYDHIVNNGGWQALEGNFANYTPPYLYMMVLASQTTLPKIVAIKAISIIFDFILAFLVYFIVGLKYKTNLAPIAAFFAVLFSPTVLLNGAFWAQCDVIYTSFLVASLFCLLFHIKAKNQGRKAFLPVFFSFVFFGVALSFKLQAVFFLPILVAVFLRGRANLLYFLIPPAIYFLSILPSYFLGRDLIELLRIYADQGNTYHDLTKNAPTFYQWFNNDYDNLKNFGLLLATSVGGALCYFFARIKNFWRAETWVLFSTISVIALPFFLPKMHERYFFPADIFTIIYAFYFPKDFWLPIVITLCSFYSYGPFLLGVEVFELPLVSLAVLACLVYLLRKAVILLVGEKEELLPKLESDQNYF